MTNEFGTLERLPNVLETVESYSHHIALRSYKISLESKMASASSLTDDVLEKETIVLAASGGTAPYPNKLGVKGQKNDVFIQSLRMTNTNGLNGGGDGRISPVTQMELSIVETGGAEFLASLTAGTAILNQRDQVQTVVLKQEAPFLVTISFNDQTASGTAKDLSGYTKHIKVRITKCQFSVKATGVYYELLCTPYAHMALTDTFQNPGIGGGYTLEGSTIGEFINGPKGLKAALTEAVKANNKDEKGNVETPYAYEFRFHNAIAESFRDSVLAAVSSGNEDTNIDSMPFNRITDLAPAQEQAGSESATATTQKDTKAVNQEVKNSVATTGNIRKIHINKDTPIHVIIERLIMNSAHIKNEALKNPKEYPPFIPFVKVIPIVETGDQRLVKDQNKVAKTVIFNIVGIQIPFIRSIDTANTDAAKTAIDKVKSQTFKAYNYLFTGGNRSILNFDLRYDNLFQQAYTSWNRTFANQNQVSDRSKVDPKGDKGAAAANQASADNSKNIAPSTSQDKKDIPIEKQAQRNTDEASGMPKDYDSAAQWFRTNLSEIFANQVEKSVYRIQVDLIGDPDFISEVDIVPTQAALEAKLAAGAGSSPAQSASPGSAGSPGAAAARAKFNPFEPYYLQFTIGNSLGDNFSHVEFSGYYAPVTFKHTFEKGKFVTQVDAYRVQGINLKVTPTAPDPGTAPVASQESVIKVSATGSGFKLPGAKTPSLSLGGLDKTLQNASSLGPVLGNAASAGAKEAQGVASKMLPGASISPGNTPPQEYVADAGKVDVPKTLPANTAAPKSIAEAKAVVGKILGGTIDATPGEDVKSAPSTQSLVDSMKSSNKLSEEVQKLAATVPDVAGKMAGELNSMMEGMGSKASGVMSGAMGDISKALGGAKTGLASAAGKVAKAGLSKLKSALGGPGAGTSTTGTSNVTETASNALSKAAPEIASAATELAAKIPSFQIPGMPIMAGPTTEDLTKKIQAAAPALGEAVADAAKGAAGAAGALVSKAAAGATTALSDAAGKLSGPAGDKAAGALSKVAGAAGDAAADLVSKVTPEEVKGEGTKLIAAINSKVKDVMGSIGAIDPKAALDKAAESVSGVGLASPGVPDKLGGLLKGAATKVSTALTGAVKGLTKSLTGGAAGGTSSAAGTAAAAVQSATATSPAEATSTVAKAGASALSGVVAAASKGLGGSSLSDTVKDAATAASGPLSGLKNEVNNLATRVANFKFPEIKIEVPQLSGEVAKMAESAKGELAKLSASTVGSTPGLSSLSVEAKEDLSKKLAVGALSRANAFVNTIPGSVKAVGLNDVAPATILNPDTGKFEIAPPAAAIEQMKASAANLNTKLTSALQKNAAPSLETAKSAVSSNPAISKLTGGG